MAIPNNEKWHSFFQVYQSLPELWQVKSDVYKNKSKKNKAWETLLLEYKEIDPEATVEKLKAKLNSIRTTYRRELKKVNDSVRSGAGEDDVYVPSIWYISCLDFLKDQEVQSTGVDSIDCENRETPTIQAQPKRSKTNTLDNKDKFLQKAVEHLEHSQKQKDDAATFSEYWACLFRKLSATQQVYARKAIEDILLLGQLNQLTLNTVSMPTSNPSSLSTSRTSTPHSFPAASPIPSNEPVLLQLSNDPPTFTRFQNQHYPASLSTSTTSTLHSFHPASPLPSNQPVLLQLPNQPATPTGVENQYRIQQTEPDEYEYDSAASLLRDPRYQ